MPDCPLLSEAEQDGLLLEISRLARRFAIGRVSAADVDDVAQDAVASCLVSLREGKLIRPPRNPQAFVRRIVKARVADRLRKKESNEDHDGEHLRTRTLSRPEWMRPNCDWNEKSILQFQHDVMAKLPRRCRLAYYMVRMEGATYGQAAKRLGVSRDVVHMEIKHAHRLFRQELRQLGISTPATDFAALPASEPWRRNEERFAPGYPANRPTVAAEWRNDTSLCAGDDGCRPVAPADRPDQDMEAPVDATHFPDR